MWELDKGTQWRNSIRNLVKELNEGTWTWRINLIDSYLLFVQHRMLSVCNDVTFLKYDVSMTSGNTSIFERLSVLLCLIIRLMCTFMTIAKSGRWSTVLCNSEVTLADTMVCYLPPGLNDNDCEVLKDVEFMGTKRADQSILSIPLKSTSLLLKSVGYLLRG